MNLIVFSSEYNNNAQYQIDRNYLEKFLVGLIDGDGYINTSLLNNRFFRFEIRILLKCTLANEKMLNLITTKLGFGRCYKYQVKNKNAIIKWVVNSRVEIFKILTIFEKFPPLTRIRLCQLERLKFFLNNPCIATYLKTKGNFIESSTIIIKKAEEYLTLPYFSEWLSGFIEAEGSFYINNNTLVFEIGQNNEYYLIKAIQYYFKIDRSIEKRNYRQDIDYFRTRTSKKIVIQLIILHITKWPLLGEKNVSFNNIFIKKQIIERVAQR